MNWYAMDIYARDRQTELMRDGKRAHAVKQCKRGRHKKDRGGMQTRDSGSRESPGGELLPVRREGKARQGLECPQEAELRRERNGGAA